MMKPVASPWIRYAVGVICAVGAFSTAPAFAQSAPFAGMAGNWAGNGSVQLADGTNERLRCRATYAVSGGGLALQQTLRCASDSYKFDLSSNVQSQGDHVSGSWTEANRNISGSVSGKASGGQVDVLVDAPGFAANLIVATRGNKQSVSISSKGEIRSVNISMTKG